MPVLRPNHLRLPTTAAIAVAVLAVLAIAALAALAGPAAASPGPIGGLVSTTHPDPASWYANPDPSFTWNAAGVVGYSWLIDHDPQTIPSATVTTSAVRFSVSSATAGLQPWHLASGDLFGDGRLDLVVANYGDGTISVLKNNGDGSFGQPVTYTAGYNPHGVAVADFNGDGRPDVVVANWGDNTVSVLLNKGDGTLKPAVSYNVGANPSQVAIADFNSDGRPDLAVANYASSTVSVLLGNGDGTFGPAKTYATAANAEALAVGQFTSSGHADIAVADWGADSVSILLGNGDGTFKHKVDYSVGAPSPAFPQPVANPHAIVVADLNGDGRADLAVANWSNNAVSVLLGKGDGTFALAARYAGGYVPSDLAATDVNGDGKPDLAVTSWGDDTVRVLLGKGDGSFLGALAIAVPGSPHALAISQFAAAGAPDLAVACNDASGTTVALLRNITLSAPFVANFTGLADGQWYFHVRGIDAAGSAGVTATCPVRIDTTRPTVSASAPNGWSKDDVIVTLSAGDATSGVAATQYRPQGSGTWHVAAGSQFVVAAAPDHANDGSHIYEYRALDEAGNASDVHTCTVHIDTQAPATRAAGLAPDARSDWQQAGGSFSLTSSDAGSGVAQTFYTVDGGAQLTDDGTAHPVTGDGSHRVLYWSIDRAGNVEAYGSGYVNIDGTAPTVSADAAAGWSKDPVTVTLNAHDATSGVGATQFRLQGDGSWLTATDDKFTVAAPADHTNDGAHTYEYRALDAAGNASSIGVCTAYIDTAPPSTTSNAPKGWVKHAVTVKLAATDSRSGTSGGGSGTFYRLDRASGYATGSAVTISSQGVHTLRYFSRDAAGNDEAVHTVQFGIASTGPVISVSRCTGKHGHTIVLRYRIASACPSVTKVRIVVVDAHHHVVFTSTPGTALTGSWHTVRWPAKKRGAYVCYATAIDLAGNAPSKVGHGAIVVR